MATAAITANSVNGQLTQLEQQFTAVIKSAGSFEVQNDRTTQMLHNALDEVYTFGENLIALADKHQIPLVTDFLRAKKVFNEKVRKKPYIGLVNAAFVNTSPSSRSQYATVLQFARESKVPTSGFVAWLTKMKGIEGARSEAVKAQASSVWQQQNASRKARVTQAGTDLLAGPLSSAVALPAGIVAPEGFAIVLAAIDSANNASIVKVIHDTNDSAKIEPVLLSLAAQPVPRAKRGLDELYRAVDLCLRSTPDKTTGKDRHLLVQNTNQHGILIGSVETISEAYSAPAATMTLDQPIGQLKQGDRFVFDGADARHFLQVHDQHQNWTLDDKGVLNADGLPQAIQLTPLPAKHSYRVADVQQSTTKQFHATVDDLRAHLQYVADEKRDWTAANKRRGTSTRAFPVSLELGILRDRLTIGFPHSTRDAGFADTQAHAVEEDRLLAVSDIDALVRVLVDYEADVDGWVMDSQVDDAALVLDAYVDSDSLRVVMPTRTGSDYNQVSTDLV